MLLLVYLLFIPMQANPGYYLEEPCDENMKFSSVVESREEEKFYTQEVLVSHYSASEDECGKTDGVTASGEIATEGITVAADHLPLGTEIILNGKPMIVQDRFGGGYTDKIDVFCEDRTIAEQKGIYRTTILIKEEN